MQTKLYKLPSIVHSSVPSGVYSGTLSDVTFNLPTNRVSLSFVLPKGFITRSFEATVLANSKLVEFSQGITSPVALPQILPVQSLVLLLTECIGRDYMLAYTELPGRTVFGALSVVPLPFKNPANEDGAIEATRSRKVSQ